MNLTPTEQLYFDALKRSPDGLTTHALLETQAPAPSRSSGLVARHISMLRKKLPAGQRIIAIPGFGYKLVND